MATKNRKRFIILTTVFWLLYCIFFNLFGYKASVVASITVVLLFFFLETGKKWLFTLSALPFMGMFKIAPSMPSTSVILYLILIIDTLSHGYKLKQKFFIRFIACAGIQFVLALIYESSLLTLISIIINLLFINQSCELLNSLGDEKQQFFFDATLIYLFSTVVMSLMALIYPGMAKTVVDVYQSIYINGTLTARYSGLAGDPNYYCQLITIALSLTISIFLVRRIRMRQTILLAMCAALLLYCGVLTLSKSYYVTVAIIFAASFYYLYKQSIKNRLLMGFLMVLTPLIIYAGYYLLINFVLPGIYQRITSTVDLTSGRTEIWGSYFKLIFSRIDVLMVGAGVNNAKNLLIPFYGKAQAAHNVFIELLADYGIVGCILLFGMFSSWFKMFVKNLNKPMVMYFLAFLATAMSLSLSAYDTICFVIPMLCLLPNETEEINRV